MTEITEGQVIGCLERSGVKYQTRGRYLITQCPLHDDKNASCQIFLDDWFCKCHAGCGRFHITKAYPELKSGSYHAPAERRSKIEAPREYKQYELAGEWMAMPLIPRDHVFKHLPLEVLDELGWRWDEPKDSYFIPYFNKEKTSIPFAQWRHLHGERRFTFLAGAKPTLYGKWNIAPGERLFIVEGTSDCATMERSGVPWIGAPSAASGAILKNFAKASIGMGITLVYAGDNDAAGDILKVSLDESGAAYRVCQPPKSYKDWGEMYEAVGKGKILERCMPYLEE